MLSKRERYVAILAAVLVALFVADRYALSPLFDARDRLAQQHVKLARELSRAHSVMARARVADRLWRDFTAAGLGGNPSAAESNLLNAVRQWSHEAGLTLASIRPDPAPPSQGLETLSFQAIGHGSMRAVARFLYSVRNAQTPVRISELQITSRTAGSDDLTLQVRISSVWNDGQAAVKPVSGR